MPKYYVQSIEKTIGTEMGIVKGIVDAPTPQIACLIVSEKVNELPEKFAVSERGFRPVEEMDLTVHFMDVINKNFPLN